MTEAEILQLSFSANEAVASLFSIFFSIVSAYIAGLYFFIYQAPTTLTIIAFGLLTIGFFCSSGKPCPASKFASSVSLKSGMVWPVGRRVSSI